jgi:hypothetical protein
MIMNVVIILATFIVLHYAYERSKDFKIAVDQITKLANWGIFILTALISIAIIYFTQI